MCIVCIVRIFYIKKQGCRILFIFRKGNTFFIIILLIFSYFFLIVCELKIPPYIEYKRTVTMTDASAFIS